MTRHFFSLHWKSGPLLLFVLNRWGVCGVVAGQWVCPFFLFCRVQTGVGSLWCPPFISVVTWLFVRDRELLGGRSQLQPVASKYTELTPIEPLSPAKKSIFKARLHLSNVNDSSINFLFLFLQSLNKNNFYFRAAFAFKPIKNRSEPLQLSM